MKRTLTALALVASLGAFAAPAANAMGEELTMLELAVDRVFDRVGVEAPVTGLTVAQLSLIKNVLAEGLTNEQTKERIEAIISNN